MLGSGLLHEWRMETFLFKVRHAFDHRKDGITVTPGVVHDMLGAVQAAPLKIKRPDGKVCEARVSKISQLCQAPEERIALCLSGNITLEDVPVGAEVYLVIPESAPTEH